MAQWYGIVFIYQIFFIHLSLSGHSGLFYNLDIVNNPEMKGCVSLFSILISHSLDVYWVVALLNHMVGPSLIFLCNFHTIFYNDCIILCSINSVCGFPIPHFQRKFLNIVILTVMIW
jgi:hypothetical protein